MKIKIYWAILILTMILNASLVFRDLKNWINPYPYEYFITYDYWEKDDSRSKGSIKINRKIKVKNWEDITGIQEHVKKENQEITIVVISNIIRLPL